MKLTDLLSRVHTLHSIAADYDLTEEITAIGLYPLPYMLVEWDGFWRSFSEFEDLKIVEDTENGTTFYTATFTIDRLTYDIGSSTEKSCDDG